MQTFIRSCVGKVTGVMSGFDRLRLRGTLRYLANASGMRSYLWNMKVPLKDFKAHVESVTERLRQAVHNVATSAGLTVQYISSPRHSKEQIARRLADERNVESGLVCLLSSVEPCWSFELRRNREAQLLELRSALRECLHYYYYLMHPQFGFMHIRLQSWFPFNMHVCLNGREWLARQMDAEGLRYLRRENALGAAETGMSFQQIIDPVSRPVRWKGRRERALRPMSPDDRALLAAVGRGEFLISGFRNRDIRLLLCRREPSDRLEARRQSSAIPRTRRHQLTPKGRQLTLAVATAQEASIQSLTKAA